MRATQVLMADMMISHNFIPNNNSNKNRPNWPHKPVGFKVRVSLAHELVIHRWKWGCNAELRRCSAEMETPRWPAKPIRRSVNFGLYEIVFYTWRQGPSIGFCLEFEVRPKLYSMRPFPIIMKRYVIYGSVRDQRIKRRVYDFWQFGYHNNYDFDLDEYEEFKGYNDFIFDDDDEDDDLQGCSDKSKVDDTQTVIKKNLDKVIKCRKDCSDTCKELCRRACEIRCTDACMDVCPKICIISQKRCISECCQNCFYKCPEKCQEVCSKACRRFICYLECPETECPYVCRKTCQQCDTKCKKICPRHCPNNWLP